MSRNRIPRLVVCGSLALFAGWANAHDFSGLPYGLASILLLQLAPLLGLNLWRRPYALPWFAGALLVSWPGAFVLGSLAGSPIPLLLLAAPWGVAVISYLKGSSKGQDVA